MSVVANLYYFPPISYFSTIIHHNDLVLEVEENYQKRTWRNRCELAGSHGVEKLNIPLKKGKHQQQNIRKTQISYDEDWRTVHWRNILTNYGSAPFFIHFRDQIQDIYSASHTRLFDFNLQVLQFIIAALRINIKVSFTTTFKREYLEHHDIRDNFSEPIELVNMPPYPQVFSHKSDFIPNLSILDLLMCQGPSAIIYLKNLRSNIIPKLDRITSSHE